MSDPLLLTPGPLTTSPRTRAAMGRDLGSRDAAFTAVTVEIRRRLADLAGAPDLAAVLLQGSGTFAVEAMIGTLIPRDGRGLVLVNGAYGERMLAIGTRIGRDLVALRHPETEPIDVDRLRRALRHDPGVTHVLAVHCETTTGLLNPLADIAAATAEAGRELLIDAMSAFGALPLAGPFQAVAASSNKCLEGVPGMGFVLARRNALRDAEGRAPSLALDLAAQERRFERDGQWRFTPPVQVVTAFAEALRQHADEGGVAGRGARYSANLAALLGGMTALGFRPLLPDAVQAPIIVTFHAPQHPAWDFGRLYDALYARGFAIYPGKLTALPTFRVGCIGQVRSADLERFTAAVAEVLDDLGIRLLED